uniref:Col_cuticle_N domain-containing protein n=1 Tax=Panagrellus redivivus TaxID=6233 RepID=A0A7E4VC48_PANRE
MTVLGVVVAVGIVLISMITGGLVFLKLRTDRLIEEHNRNMRMVNVPVGSHRPMAAQHPLPTVIPFESNRMVLGPTGIVDSGIDKAADTVFFGQPNELRMQ